MVSREASCRSIHPHKIILHCLVNEVFQFPHPVSIICFLKAIQNQVGFTLKLINYEPNVYNNEEHLRECIQWCQKFLELWGIMVDVVYIDEVGFNLNLTPWLARAHRGQRCQWIRPAQRGQNLSSVVAVGHEGVIAQDITLGAYNTTKFIKLIHNKVIPSLDRQRFILMDNVSFHRSREIQQTFEDVGHIYFYLPSYSPFLNVVEWVFGHIKNHVWRTDLQSHQALLLDIDDDIQAITTNIVQGWLREVNVNFGRVGRKEWLKNYYYYIWCTVLCKIKLYNSWNWFCEVVNMGTKSSSFSQLVVKLVESSSSIGCLYSKLGLQFQQNW